MRRKDVEDCEYLTIYLFINKENCGLKICHVYIKKNLLTYLDLCNVAIFKFCLYSNDFYFCTTVYKLVITSEGGNRINWGVEDPIRYTRLLERILFSLNNQTR